MTLIRARQSITRVFPHQANRRFILPKRRRLARIDEGINVVEVDNSGTTIITSDPSGIPTGQFWTASVWFIPVDQVDNNYFVSTDDDPAAFNNPAISFRRITTVPQGILDWSFRIGNNEPGRLRGNIAMTEGNTWNLVASMNAQTGRAQDYVNGQPDADSVSGSAPFTIDPLSTLSLLRNIINSAGNQYFTGKITELWFTNEFVDLDGGGIDKFINPDGTPADLGANGENPTGTQALVYFGRGMTANTGGNAANGTGPGWNGGANLGSIGNFIRSGNVVTDTTP